MYYERNSGFFPRATPVVKYLVFITSGAYLLGLLLELAAGRNLSVILGLVPALFWSGALWQPTTYLFLHGGVFHLLLNMLVLWMFGTALEAAWGGRRFLIFYFICGIGAGLLNAVVTPSSEIPIIGASGAIYGLLMAFGILFPEQLIYIWGIFPVRARYFVIGIGLIEFLTAMSTTRSGIAHVAHLGGMLFGLLYLKWGDWQKSVSGWRAGKKRRRHLKVVWDQEQEMQKLRKEIDNLLDKAGRDGIESLTIKERGKFRELSEKLQKLENRT